MLLYSSESVKGKVSKTGLTHFQPMFDFYAPWKHQKTRVYDVFRGYGSGALVENDLIIRYFLGRKFNELDEIKLNYLNLCLLAKQRFFLRI